MKNNFLSFFTRKKQKFDTDESSSEYQIEPETISSIPITTDELDTPPNSKEERRYEFLLDIRDKNGKRKNDPGYDETTLFIPDDTFKKMTNFEKQFWEIKKENFDAIVCFKKGKFYELYENDAEAGAKLFDLKITDRVNMKMAGFPETSFDYWAGKFLEHGYRVARVEQVENLIAKGIREREKNEKKEKLIKRELKEIVTAGTIYNLDNLKNEMSVFLAVVHKNLTDNQIGIVLYDASTNKVYADSFFDDPDHNQLKTVFAQNSIKELIIDFDLKLDCFPQKIRPIKGGLFMEFKNQFENFCEFQCFVFLCNYMETLKRLNFTETVCIERLRNNENNNLILDSITIKNMEILSNNDDESENYSLFKNVNFCGSSFGKRLLKNYLLCPLKNEKKIVERQNCARVVDLMDLNVLKDTFKRFGDLERIIGRCLTANPKVNDLISLVKNFKFVDSFLEEFKKSLEMVTDGNECELVKNGSDLILVKLKNLPDLSKIMDSFDKKYVINENSVCAKDDADDELNVLLKTQQEIHERMQDYLKKEKKRLKTEICFKDLGKEIFQMEVPLSVDVPDEYSLSSATKTHRRFYTPVLKELVREYKECDEMVFQSRVMLLRRAVDFLMAYRADFYKIVGFVAEIDVLCSFCVFGRTNKCEYPKFGNYLKAKGVGNAIYSGFVKSDVDLEDSSVFILTGPNMGGKSTLLRSLCYNIILAQMGMKVIADEFIMKVYDKIFTRIGANDDLSRGESTFMVEMLETAKILKEATKNSFVIMDELGRGTSVRDGEAIARAVVENLRDRNVTMFFSTHYHNMIDKINGVKKGFMSYEIIDEDVNFLYKLQSGVTCESYGIYVAKLANVPESIVEEAKSVRERLLVNWENE